MGDLICGKDNCVGSNFNQSQDCCTEPEEEGYDGIWFNWKKPNDEKLIRMLEKHLNTFILVNIPYSYIIIIPFILILWYPFPCNLKKKFLNSHSECKYWTYNPQAWDGKKKCYLQTEKAPEKLGTCDTCIRGPRNCPWFDLSPIFSSKAFSIHLKFSANSSSYFLLLTVDSNDD